MMKLIGRTRLQGFGIGISKRPKIGLLVSGLLLTMFVLVSCSSTEPTPTIAPQPTSTTLPATAVPSPTVTPVPTNTPVSTPVSRISEIELRNLDCVNFHPGVPNPDGPNHWYDISGSFLNSGSTSAQLVMQFDILDTNGSSLLTVADKELTVDSGQDRVFGEQLELVQQANEFTCRVSFTVLGDETGEQGIKTADIGSIYAP